MNFTLYALPPTLMKSIPVPEPLGFGFKCKNSKYHNCENEYERSFKICPLNWL
jgi:hypothetical protein